MKHLSIFLHYFSEQRFSDILEHFGVTKSKNETRLELSNQILRSKNFQDNHLRDFLYKAELQNFCKAAGISNCSGNKKQIWNRIILFLSSIDPNSITIRNSSDMSMFNALHIAQRFEDYWNSYDNEESALKALKNMHPELTLDDCKEVFSYALTAYKEAVPIVKSNTLSYSIAFSKKQENERVIKPFEKKFLEKYNKLNEQDCWIFDQIYFWYILK